MQLRSRTPKNTDKVSKNQLNHSINHTSPSTGNDNADIEPIIPAKHQQKPQPLILRKRLCFIIGILLGSLITIAFIPTNTVVNIMPPQLTEFSQYLSDFDVLSYLPESFDFLKTSYQSMGDITSNADQFLPGSIFAKQGFRAKHPVVFIPGIVSTGLEAWNAHPVNHSEPVQTDTFNNLCGLKYFRKRMWGTMNQFRAVLFDKDCWVRHMMLNPKTGLDPPHVKLRAALGLDAADYLFPGYWVWAKVISNLAAIGYDSNSMHLASYDWRLPFENLEKRDLYFTKLKSVIEILVKGHGGKKVVIVSHSMGSLVFKYFLRWVEVNGSEEWPNDHFHNWINICGPMLGSPKTIPALVSGEMRDTAQLNTFSSYILDNFFRRKERWTLFRSWGGLSSLLPMGGNAIWGYENKYAPDDLNETGLFSSIMETDNADIKNVTVDGLEDFLRDVYNGEEQKNWAEEYSLKNDPEIVQDKRKWANSLESKLPKFTNSSFKITCIYGTGLETERKHFYTKLDEEFLINQDIQGNGILLSDGDGTVPLISLGYMCRKGWKNPALNPSKVPVTIREIQHEIPSGTVERLASLRGNGVSADHVDILGNQKLIEDILRVVSGNDDAVEDRIFSRIQDIVNRVEI